jgi:transcription elongation GreA/GreB family factor
MQIPKRRGEWKRDLGPEDEYLTQDAIEELRQELHRIEKARPAAVAELQRTREMGDLSENFAYTVAKGKVMGMDAAIFRIKERLKYAKPIKLGGNGGGVLAVGSIAEVEVNGKARTLTLVGVQQVDLSKGFISYHSPVGSALMGKMAGDSVMVEANGKKIEYRILRVR